MDDAETSIEVKLMNNKAMALGLMIIASQVGAGLGFEISSTMDLRVEYVMRDTVDSFQVNLVIRQ